MHPVFIELEWRVEMCAPTPFPLRMPEVIGYLVDNFLDCNA